MEQVLDLTWVLPVWTLPLAWAAPAVRLLEVLEEDQDLLPAQPAALLQVLLAQLRVRLPAAREADLPAARLPVALEAVLLPVAREEDLLQVLHQVALPEQPVARLLELPRAQLLVLLPVAPAELEVAALAELEVVPLLALLAARLQVLPAAALEDVLLPAALVELQQLRVPLPAPRRVQLPAALPADNL